MQSFMESFRNHSNDGPATPPSVPATIGEDEPANNVDGHSKASALGSESSTASGGAGSIVPAAPNSPNVLASLGMSEISSFHDLVHALDAAKLSNTFHPLAATLLKHSVSSP